MDSKELKRAYEGFFAKSEAGKHFVASVVSIIADNHEKAENDPERARDHVQRAKGAREVIEHIHSVQGGAKKA